MSNISFELGSPALRVRKLNLKGGRKPELLMNAKVPEMGPFFTWL